MTNQITESAGILTKEEWLEFITTRANEVVNETDTVNLDVCKSIADIEGIEHFMSGPLALYKNNTVPAAVIIQVNHNLENMTSQAAIESIKAYLHDYLVFPYVAFDRTTANEPILIVRAGYLPRSIFN